MPLPGLPPPPPNLLFGLDSQLGTSPRMQNGPKKRKRDIVPSAASEANKQNAAIIKKLKLDPKFEEPLAVEQDSMEIDNHEGPSEKIKLRALKRKSKELQYYLNQLQDAVTIGMFRLRDLKKQVSTATAALKAAQK
ncbi:hypothetical protein F5B18DRAFT_656706 [Nemania serpens]|nr:hypothetical protein F5B18DRAFT_656706 [Nemania serpens]